MQLQRIKMVAAAGWALAVFGTAAAVGVSGTGMIAVAAVGFLPPLVLLFLWKEPAETLSESIDHARR